jgi:thiol-disulfide isomerase/thioredoxin
MPHVYLLAAVILVLSHSVKSFTTGQNSRFRSVVLRAEEDEEMAMLRAQIEGLIQPDIEVSSSTAIVSPPRRLMTGVNNLVIAGGSTLMGVACFLFLHSQPTSSVALLKAMERDSAQIDRVLCNGKPTVVDFYADWCESCKVMAPSMRQLELQYRDSVNFITIDGANPKNSRLVGAFKVDGIPHVAFVTPEAEVKTALVGAVPKQVLDSQLEALLNSKELPYEGYDAFEEESHFPLSKEYKACQLL